MLPITPIRLPDPQETEAQREIRTFREQDAAIRKARRRARLTAPVRTSQDLSHFILSQIRKRAAALAAARRDARNARRKTLQDQAPQM